MHGTELHWLPKVRVWSEQLAALPQDAGWEALCALANARLSAIETLRLDRRRGTLLRSAPSELATKPVRLAVLGASTLDHLLPAIRVGRHAPGHLDRDLHAGLRAVCAGVDRRRAPACISSGRTPCCSRWTRII